MVNTSLTWRQIAKDLIRSFGLEVRRVPRFSDRDLPVENVQPYADYAPWLRDGTFLKLYEKIRDHTLVDRYRCWELWTLLNEVRSVPGILVEVGVWRGGTGVLLACRARQLGIDSPIFLCDTFNGVVKASQRDAFYRGGEHADASPEIVERLAETLGIARIEILRGIFPDETGPLLPLGPIRFCHIDVDTHDSAADSFRWIWPRLSAGGIVVFDDYGFSQCAGVASFVDSLRGQPGQVVVHNLNGHAVVVKTGA
ncbi:TylF/MycF/NovP-related O-methyltransferase [Thermogutta sp.]|uniref:TylF/MycF/NovP-related O-methyltransferase n=1 Tax=Thermogutta sp. TaxID=1962930 RepID=UPI0032209B38